MYVLQGRSALACAAFRQALKLHPTNFHAQFALSRLEKAHYQLGILLARLGDREGSKKEFALVDMLKANSNAKPEVRIVEPEPQ